MSRDDLLESWKEIAAYLGHCVRTCQLWERNKNLPVHRLEEGPKAHVFAFKRDLDRWLEECLRARERNLLRLISGYLKRIRR